MLPIDAIAQKRLIKEKNEVETFHAYTGAEVYTGQLVRIGAGTMPNGDFKYITGRQHSAVHNAYSNRKSSLPRNLSGLNFKITKIDTRGDKEQSLLCYPIIRRYSSYEIDINNAIASGEIVVHDEFKTKPQTVLVKISNLKHCG